MPRFTFRQFEYLVAVGDTGSIARAAENLNVSSPSISSAISQLEEELGISLFVRQHAQGLSTTKGGRRVIDQAKHVLKEAATIADIASDVSSMARGPLAVGCLVTFAQLVLPRMRAGYEAAFPDVRIEQSELNQAEIFSALRRSDIDIALTYDMDIPTDLHFTGLVRLRPLRCSVLRMTIQVKQKSPSKTSPICQWCCWICRSVQIISYPCSKPPNNFPASPSARATWR